MPRNTGATFGSIPIQPGEIADGTEFERPLSAPPPDGFGVCSEDRNRLVTELLWGGIGGNSKGLNNNDVQYQGGNAPGTVVTSSMGNIRSSSFSDLAAVFGTGLAESMEDATQERNNINSIFDASLQDTNDPLSSYQRMTRHAASRLIGQQSSSASTSFPNYQPNNIAQTSRTDVVGSQKNSDHGFPTSLSSPERKNYYGNVNSNNNNNNNTMPNSLKAEKEKIAHRSTTPVQMYPGRALPVTHDIGTNVMEPEGESPSFGSATITPHLHEKSRNSQQAQLQRVEFEDSQRNIREIERGMHNLWSLDAKEFVPQTANATSANSSISDVGTEISPRQAEHELLQYIWDVQARPNHSVSRTLVILHAVWIRVPDLRSACENFGVIESFRADFSSWGIFFVSYYDTRSAQYAATELQSILQRLSVMQRSSDEILVRYCLSLSSSSQYNDSQFTITDLPSEVDEYALRAMLSSYGALQSVEKKSEGCFLVEFFNLQDTKQALLELDSSQPWGPHVNVQMNPRQPAERKAGRDLLAMIGRWRHGLRLGSNQHDDGTTTFGGGKSSDPWRAPTQRPEASPQTQYILGQDGRYTQVVVQHAPVSGYQQTQFLSHGIQTQHVIQGSDGKMYIASPVSQQLQSYQGSPFPQVVSSTPYTERGRYPSNTYYAAQVSSASEGNSLSGRSHRSVHSNQTTNSESGDNNRHLKMDLDHVEIGQDTRTSLMVRNIPNKYTQQMLLAEFEENGCGPGVIDFFYLPIDFKNRCNRGYAFINFVDFKDILAFHQQYFGKHWRTFNSDKICDITYARIQGKEAMLKRFENSALMEKDDEYKPLVFVSDGPLKGQRIPFPDLTRKDLHNRRLEV